MRQIPTYGEQDALRHVPATFVLQFFDPRLDKKNQPPVTDSPEVFISYSREDASRVLELAAKLREAGVSLWIDQGGIDSASPWSEQIVNALDSAKVLLLMVSESAVHSHNV